MDFNFFQLVKAAAAGALHQLPAHRWDALSINNVGHQGTVTGHHVSFDILTQRAEADWTFTDLAGASHTISVSEDAHGSAQIVLDGVTQANPRVAIVPIVLWFRTKSSVRLIFAGNGTREEYRFDGEN